MISLDPMALHWYWWIFGLVLMLLELFVPGTFFLWMGISAMVVGIGSYVFPDLSWQVQLLSFSLLSVLTVAVWRQILKRYPTHTDHPLLNRRGAQYVGRVFTLERPIVNGRGRLRVDDTLWKIEGRDCPAKTRVRVVSVDGTLLRVEPLD